MDYKHLFYIIHKKVLKVNNSYFSIQHNRKELLSLTF